MPDRTIDFQELIDALDGAAIELRNALEHIAQAQDALQVAQKLDTAQQATRLEAIWQHLFALSDPIVNAGAFVVDVMGEIGQQIGAKPSAPKHMEWLSGTDVRAEHAYQERQQKAAEILEWLEPILDRVSARTRNIVIRAIKRAVDGQESPILIERLTQETFMRDLQRVDHTGLFANMRGLGLRGLRELRETIGIASPTSLKTEEAP